MRPSFEQPQNTSAENKKEESPEQRRSDEYFQQAQQEVIDFLTDGIEAEVNIRLAEDPTFSAKGRNWELSKIPDEYQEIAFMQKKLRLIGERLDDAIVENNETEPGTAAEAKSYFAVQLFARAKQVQEEKIKAAAGQLGLRIQHPGIAEALDGDKG